MRRVGFLAQTQFCENTRMTTKSLNQRMYFFCKERKKKHTEGTINGRKLKVKREGVVKMRFLVSAHRFLFSWTTDFVDSAENYEANKNKRLNYERLKLKT